MQRRVARSAALLGRHFSLASALANVLASALLAVQQTNRWPWAFDAPALCGTPLVAARKSRRSPQIRLKRRPPPPAPMPAHASRLVLWRQADHPALRRVANRRWAGDRQELPIRQARRDSIIGLHARVRRRRGRRSHRLATAYRRGWRPECTDLLHHRRRHQPRHLEHRRAAVVSRNQLGAWSAAHRRLRGYRCVPMGRQRWRYREFAHARPPVVAVVVVTENHQFCSTPR